jgi:glyoxylase-like metal-dependent hydrolase (beta-lactamase superfamily II)
MQTTDPTRPIKWYAGLVAVFFGILPTTMVTLLVAGGHTPGSVGFLLIGGIPLLLVGLANIVQGFRVADPEVAARLLYRGMGFIAGADVLLLGGNALIRMASGS